MCLQSHKSGTASSLASPSKLVARTSASSWTSMLWSPVDILLASTTIALGVAGIAVPTRLDLPVPGSLAAVVQGVLVLLHSLAEGPRLQVLPLYVPTLLLIANAATGGFGGVTALVAAMGVTTLLLASVSLLLCYWMPRLLPMGGRGPYAVGIATEHIRTPVGDNSTNGACPDVEELWPLELMAQVFYPVEKSRVAKLPWFPSRIARFRRSLSPATAEAARTPFGLTQMGIVGAGVILGLEASLLPHGGPSLRDLVLSRSTFSTFLASPHAWTLAVALLTGVACFATDTRIGLSRSAYQTRYLAKEQARRIATFVGMPGWLTEHVSRLHGPGFEAGHFHGPDAPCFPVAPVAPGERKRPMVIFTHGLGGNRSLYAEHGAAYAAQGYVAVVLEHNDGSGSSCMLPDGRITEYAKAPNPKNVGAPENRDFRLAQLKRRGREVQLTRAHLARLVRGSATDFEHCRRVGLGDVLDIKRPAFVGHSFGGGTVLQVLSDERERRRRSSSGGGGGGGGGDHDGGVGTDPEETGYSMAVIMDAWTYPTSDEARAQSIDIPVMFITNDGFLGEEGKKIEEGLTDAAVRMVREGANDLAIQLRLKDAAHNNFSDSALFSPVVMRKLNNAGKIDGVTFIDQITRLTLCALEVFLRRRTDSGDAVKTPAPANLASSILGSDFAKVFPEARVKKACARGVLPPMEYAGE
ncbi:unnamed protein product [Scytosiphon promiscuus]